MYFILTFEGLYRSNAISGSWMEIPTDLGEIKINCLTIIPKTLLTIRLGTNGGGVFTHNKIIENLVKVNYSLSELSCSSCIVINRPSFQIRLDCVAALSLFGKLCSDFEGLD